MMKNKKYPSKLLLIGEYTVLYNSKALALPLEMYYAQWKFGKDENSKKSRDNIFDLLEYLKNQNLDEILKLEVLENDLKNGLYLYSNIPQGYGLGSSGSLCAAILDKYSYKKQYSIQEARKILQLMESYFHNNSSGIDPLVSYFNSTIIIEGEKIELVKNFKLNPDFFLIDTLKERITSNLVQNFNIKMNNLSFRNIVEGRISDEVNSCIDNIVNGKNFLSNYIEISKLQLEFFSEMIPTEFIPFWKEGIASRKYFIKLLGAGGGGFLLCYSNIPADSLGIKYIHI